MDFAHALTTIGYIVLCLMVGVCGRYRRSGFVLSGLLALILTPPVVLLLLYAFGSRGDALPRSR